MPRFTPEEDNIIRNHFPKGGDKEIHAMMPHHDKQSIRIRAMQLGVKRVDAKPLPHVEAFRKRQEESAKRKSKRTPSYISYEEECD